MRSRGLFGILFTAALLAGGCSFLNRQGPSSTCSDLQNGAINACQSGIIANCSNGKMSYEVCDDSGACGQSWQVPAHYRCNQDAEPQGVGSSSGGSSGSSSGGGSGSSSGGANVPEVVLTCGTCPQGYVLVADTYDDSCKSCYPQSECALTSLSVNSGACGPGASGRTVMPTDERNCSSTRTFAVCVSN